MTRSRRRFGPQCRGGFTILELMVVLVVAGLLARVTVGKFHSIMVKTRVQRAAASLQTDLESAFLIASRNRTPVQISWNSSKMQMDVTNAAATIFYRRTPFGKEGYGLTSSNVTFSASPVTVYPNGLANSALTVTVSVESNTKTLSMTRGGLVLVQ